MQSVRYISKLCFEERTGLLPDFSSGTGYFFAGLMPVYFEADFQGYQSMVTTAVSQVAEQLLE